MNVGISRDLFDEPPESCLHFQLVFIDDLFIKDTKNFANNWEDAVADVKEKNFDMHCLGKYCLHVTTNVICQE